MEKFNLEKMPGFENGKYNINYDKYLAMGKNKEEVGGYFIFKKMIDIFNILNKDVQQALIDMNDNERNGPVKSMFDREFNILLGATANMAKMDLAENERESIDQKSRFAEKSLRKELEGPIIGHFNKAIKTANFVVPSDDYLD